MRSQSPGSAEGETKAQVWVQAPQVVEDAWGEESK